MTRSTPNISSSGNIKPASITMMSSSYSITIMFLPISPNPPIGIIFSFDFAIILFLRGFIYCSQLFFANHNRQLYYRWPRLVL